MTAQRSGYTGPDAGNTSRGRLVNGRTIYTPRGPKGGQGGEGGGKQQYACRSSGRKGHLHSGARTCAFIFRYLRSSNLSARGRPTLSTTTKLEVLGQSLSRHTRWVGNSKSSERRRTGSQGDGAEGVLLRLRGTRQDSGVVVRDMPYTGCKRGLIVLRVHVGTFSSSCKKNNKNYLSLVVSCQSCHVPCLRQYFLLCKLSILPRPYRAMCSLVRSDAEGCDRPNDKT